MRRIFLMLKSMASDGLDAIKAKEFEHLMSITSSEQTNNRLTTICRRIINKKGYTKHSTYLYCLVNELEKIADEYRDLFTYIAENKMTVAPDMLSLLSEVNKLFVELYELFYKYDKNSAIAFDKDKAKLGKDINALDVLNHDKLVITKDALKNLAKRI